VESESAESEGLTFVRRLVENHEPPSPMAELFQTSAVAAGPGTVTLVSSPGPHAFSRAGRIHGGVLCTLLDTAIVLAAITSCAEIRSYSTVDLSVHFMRPVPAGEVTLTTYAEVLKAGARLTFAQARVEDADGTLLASATGSVFVG
jgi:uncharacterized protein (TIGR00369 family)